MNEEAFKTPINTPGLFESITKNVIRSKKRLRESYGSTTKANKKPKVEETAVPLVSILKQFYMNLRHKWLCNVGLRLGFYGGNNYFTP